MMMVKLNQTVYEDILIHMLQFGNKALKKSQEVFGLIYGIRSGDTIEIKKSIPVKHGPDCEKVFTETDLVSFQEIDEKIIEEGLEPFGYYSTHPKMGYYLSQNEIKNLSYFISDRKNEYAVALIGDHAKLDDIDDFGFQVFTLKDPAKGINSDFIKIDLEIEQPKTLTLFEKTRFIIEQAQKRQPYVEEKGTQLSMDDSVWDAFGDDETPEDKIAKKIAPILDSLSPGISNASESFLHAALLTYNEFLEDVTQFVSKTYNDPISDLVALRSAFDDGMTNVQVWFETTFRKYAVKIMDEYKRTFKMVQDSHDESILTLKMVLVNLQKEYQDLLQITESLKNDH